MNIEHRENAMLEETVQSEADDRPESDDRVVRRWKDGRVIHPGQLDLSTEGVVRGCQMITELDLRAQCERWPGR